MEKVVGLCPNLGVRRQKVKHIHRKRHFKCLLFRKRHADWWVGGGEVYRMVGREGRDVRAWRHSMHKEARKKGGGHR